MSSQTTDLKLKLEESENQLEYVTGEFVTKIWDFFRGIFFGIFSFDEFLLYIALLLFLSFDCFLFSSILYGIEETNRKYCFIFLNSFLIISHRQKIFIPFLLIKYENF